MANLYLGQRRLYRYEDLMTPCDKLASLADATAHLKPGLTPDEFAPMGDRHHR